MFLDVNGILATLGGFMGAFGVSTDMGRGLLQIAEFFLTGINMGAQLVAKVFGFFG